MLSSKYEVFATVETRRDEISRWTKVAFELLDRSLRYLFSAAFLDPFTDTADRVGPITGSRRRCKAVSRQNSDCFKLGQLSPPLIEFHDISTNFPAVYRGICEARIVETVWKWPLLDPLLANHHEISRLQGSTVCKFSSS